jgi:hypothetical protein
LEIPEPGENANLSLAGQDAIDFRNKGVIVFVMQFAGQQESDLLAMTFLEFFYHCRSPFAKCQFCLSGCHASGFVPPHAMVLFFQLPFNLVKSQPHGNMQIFMRTAFFPGMDRESPFTGHRQPHKHLEYNAPAPAVLPVDYDRTPAIGQVEPP